jgi:GrpB-like predicted nucleotidyltransferase (UPF0157 family)
MFSAEELQRLHNQRKTHIVGYNREWSRQFEQEAEILKPLFNQVILSVQHIGSTAIPGIKAKPIIDILITVNAIEEVDPFNSSMKQLGYVIGGEFGLPGRRFFCKGDEENCYIHLHVYEADHPAVQKYITFRDYMIAHPLEAKQYEMLKADLAERYFNSRTLYTQNKSNFIENIYKKAAAWLKKT